MKNKPIVFSDVDGTLYGPDFVVKPETVKHIHKAIEEHDVEFVIATGNPAFTRHQELASQLKARYIITSGGATIFDNLEKTYIYRKEINTKQQEAIIKISNDLNLQLNFWNDKDYFTLNHQPQHERSWEYSLIDPTTVVKGANKVASHVVKMELFGDAQKIKIAYDSLKPLKLQAVIMRPEHIEITALNTNKGSAIQWFIKNVVKQDEQNVMVIGDSPNDWPMFKLNCYSYAMANANTHTKEKAKHHTTAYDQNGVGMAIDDYLYRFKNIKPKK